MKHLNIIEGFAFAIVCIFVVMAVFASWLAPHNPDQMDLFNRGCSPCVKHLLGTDILGRDTLSRIMFGARISILVAIGSVTWALLLGIPVGAIAGQAGGKIDLVVMRLMDILLSLPRIVLVIFAVTVFGSGLLNMTLAIGIWNIPVFARLVRGDVLSITERDFITAANALGASPLRIMIYHILPNCLNSIIVTSTLLVSSAILVEASLSFLGLGLPPGTPSWGAMISEGREFIWTNPFLSVIPGIAIMLLVLSLNILGDHLRDELDPRKSLTAGSR